MKVPAVMPVKAMVCFWLMPRPLAAVTPLVDVTTPPASAPWKLMLTLVALVAVTETKLVVAPRLLRAAWMLDANVVVVEL